MKTSTSKNGNLFRFFFSLFILVSPALRADPPPPLTIRVACVGDSITYGAGLQDRDNTSYPACLGRLLGAGYDVRNFGVSGATMLHKGNLPYINQKAHGKALAFKPDILVIMLGTNDSKHPGPGSLDTVNVTNNWQYKSEYLPDYEALIAEFRAVNPAVKIYVCDPPPSFPGRWGINGTTIHDEVIPLVHQVAGDDKVNDIDIYGAFANHADMFPDTVHPNADGAKLMAETVYKALTDRTP
jgi:lysophospholipase L1-like esterase